MVEYDLPPSTDLSFIKSSLEYSRMCCLSLPLEDFSALFLIAGAQMDLLESVPAIGSGCIHLAVHPAA
ncbi:Protocadherin Alpha-12 [Manis pentadactyla]|nr:Protocadherin Alpha-12 [Manis pentadactyla]